MRCWGVLNSLMHQSIPAASSAPRPLPSPSDPRALAFFWPWMTNSWGWGLLSCQIPRGGDKKKRANAPSSVNAVTFFIYYTVEYCRFSKHFNVRFFVSSNVFLCNSARILIKTSRRDDMHQFMVLVLI